MTRREARAPKTEAVWLGCETGTPSQMHLFRGYFSALLFAVALAWSAAWICAPAAAQVSAQTVVVEGSSHTDAATIRSYFTGTDQASVNRAVADLSATGMFSKVSAKIVGGQVVVTIVESSQIINRVAFEGNKTLKSDQLAVEVQSKARTGFDDAKAKGDVDRIKDAYKKIGRSATQVTYRLVQLPNGRVDLVFKVDEGDKTGVREIKFVGNNAVSVLSPARADADDRDEFPLVVQEQRHLRSRSPRHRPGGDPQVLHEERLRGFPHHQHRRRLSEPTRRATSSRSRWTKARNTMCPAPP